MSSLYSLKDLRNNEFSGPFVAKSSTDAKRIVMQTLQSPGVILRVAPHEFELHYLGSFNPTTGELTSLTVKKIPKVNKPVTFISRVDTIIAEFKKAQEEALNAK